MTIEEINKELKRMKKIKEQNYGVAPWVMEKYDNKIRELENAKKAMDE